MVGLDIVERLGAAFPNSILNTHLEFIADPHHRINSYFILANCNTEEDVIAKLLEWLSREAYKSQHFNSDARKSKLSGTSACSSGDLGTSGLSMCRNPWLPTLWCCGKLTRA